MVYYNKELANAALTDAVCDVIARASSERPDRQRWTVLSIYRMNSEADAVQAGAIGGVWITEITGASRVEGEEQRKRRASFPTLAKAMNWKHWDVDSPLYRELQAQLDALLERTTLPDNLVPVTLMTEHPPCEQFAGGRFNGRTFREALTWLYGDDLDEAADLYERDWRVDPDVYHSGGGSRADVFAVLEREAEYGMPPWAETFVKAMRHFNRESFLASVR